MKKIFKLSIIFLLVIVPLYAFAQAPTPAATTGTEVLSRVSNFLGALLPLMLSIGVIIFVWGVIQYMIAQSDEAKTKGRDKILYGIIGFAVILSLWGLVTMLQTTFGIGGEPPDLSSLTITDNNRIQGVGCGDLGNRPKLQNLMGYVVCLINDSVIPFLFAVAILFFLWGRLF